MLPPPARLCDVLTPWAAQFPDKPALVEKDGTWTYGQLAARVLDAQSWLLASGVRPGDRVMLVCENCRAFVAILLALSAIDAWPVLVNARLSDREVDQIRDHCGARRVLYFTGVSPQARQHARRHAAIIDDVAGMGPLGAGTLNDTAATEPVDPVPTERIGALIYTSGTTGLPKGVMLTHRNLLFVAAVSAGIRSLTPADRLYGALPMSHAVGLSVVLLGALLAGATLFLTPRFDPVAALATFEKEELTVVLGTPSMFSLLLEYAGMKGLTQLTFPSLRLISSSGAPLQAALKASVEQVFGKTLHNGYGVTECSPNISQTIPEAPRSDISVGRILPGVEIQLLDSVGDAVAPGAVGELRVRGPNVMRGYYRAPEETAAALDAQGWFNTRDLARLDGDYLFIEGRTKELIVRFGLNVYPAEVEAVLNTHPEVLRSAVVGRTVDGASGGEEILAFVQATPGSLIDEIALADHAAHHLAPYKRPSRIVMMAQMPVTLTGKVIKGELTL